MPLNSVTMDNNCQRRRSGVASFAAVTNALSWVPGVLMVGCEWKRHRIYLLLRATNSWASTSINILGGYLSDFEGHRDLCRYSFLWWELPLQLFLLMTYEVKYSDWSMQNGACYVANLQRFSYSSSLTGRANRKRMQSLKNALKIQRVKSTHLSWHPLHIPSSESDRNHKIKLIWKIEVVITKVTS